MNIFKLAGKFNPLKFLSLQKDKISCGDGVAVSDNEDDVLSMDEE